MSSNSAPFVLDAPTLFCIAFALSFMPIAFILGRTLIPATHARNRLLFFWHAYDALTHVFIEGSFLYQCFFSYRVVPLGCNREPFFLGYKDRVYGATHGTGPGARLWQEYGKADARWAVADPCVIALEILTVFLGGPVAIYTCYLLWRASRGGNDKARAAERGAAKGKLWLVAPALATAELYGGFMTFAPEWLTGSSQLATDNPVYLWFYLFFFNTLWVFVPGWVLWEAAKELKAVFVKVEGTSVKKVEGASGKGTSGRKRQ